MAIDTSIYGMIQRPQIKSPMDMQADAFTLRNLGQESELRQQKIATARAMEQQRQAELKADQDFAGALQRNASEQELYATNPRAAATYFKGQRENQKLEMEAQAQQRAAEASAATTRKTNRETESKEYEDFTNLLGTIKDEASFHTGLSAALARGYDPQMVRMVFEQGYKPEIIEQLKTSAMNEAAKKKLEYDLEEAEQKRIMRPLEADNLRNQVKTGTPDPVTNLTAEQTKQDERARAMMDLQNQQFGETKRHNQNTEAMASQRLALDKIEKAAVAKGMSQESAKVYAIAETMVPELEQLRDAIQKDPKLAIGGILSGMDPALVRLAENAADKVGRLRSGGAVNPAEEARFMGQIARKMDVFTGDPGPAIAAINGLIKEAQTVKSKMGASGTSAAAPQVQQWGRDANGKPVRK